MDGALPPGFVDLHTATARLNSDVNLIGVVSDYLQPCQTRGSDWMCSFSLTDLSTGTYDDRLKVRFFKPMESELPRISGTGDVVLLRSVKIKQWSGMTIALSSWATTWVVFPVHTVSVQETPKYLLQEPIKLSRTPEPLPAEIRYAKVLCNGQKDSRLPGPAERSTGSESAAQDSEITSAPKPGQKDALIKDLQIDRFYNLTGQVVKLYPNNGRVELYMTDFTSNGLLYNYEWGREGEGEAREGDEYGYVPRASKKWRGPFGKMTLTVTLWPPHSYAAQQNVKDDDFVFLRNVRVKFSGDGKVEGVLHSDQRYPNRVDINVLSDHHDERVKEVLRRKKEYWKRAASQQAAFLQDIRGDKRKHCDDDETLSKAQIKRRRRKERKEKKGQKQVENDQITAPSQHTERLVTPARSRIDLNQYVSCTHPAIPTRPLSAILSLSMHELTTPNGTPHVLPFQNICSRANVRIIDFFPPQLEDFAVQQRVSEYDVLSENESDGSSSCDELESSSDITAKATTIWEWRFYLLLEDAGHAVKGETRTRMKVLVAKQDAEFLLKLDAEDLRANSKSLSLLREKLFILWGDLEERKTSKTFKALQPRDPNRRPRQIDGSKSSEVPLVKAFTCCIKEYGVRSTIAIGNEGGGAIDLDRQTGWKRKFRLFGTTIS